MGERCECSLIACDGTHCLAAPDKPDEAEANERAKDQGKPPPFPKGEIEALAAVEWERFPYHGYSWVDWRAMVERAFASGARSMRERAIERVSNSNVEIPLKKRSELCRQIRALPLDPGDKP